MKNPIASLLFVLLLPLPLFAQSFSEIAAKENKITYGGYEIQTGFNAQTRVSQATISKNGRVLIRLGYGSFLQHNTRVGLFSVLGGDTKQLIIEQYTGGAHCCSFNLIYELGRRPRLLFSNKRYGFESGNGLKMVDLNKDGRFELEQVVLTFDYFHLPHARSILPTNVLAYDERARQYRPANDRYQGYVLQRIEEDIVKVQRLKPALDVSNVWSREEYFSAVLQVVLKSLYAGKAKEAWSFYHNWYKLDDRRRIEANLRKELRTSRIYRSMYPSRQWE